MYGFCFTQPFPDLDRTRCLIVVGANPAVSKWSFLQVPAPIAALKELEARGARLFVVDPRRTETAKTAGEHVFIRPGTDVWFLPGVPARAGAHGGVDRARVAAHMRTGSTRCWLGGPVDAGAGGRGDADPGREAARDGGGVSRAPRGRRCTARPA
jgi:anaerobic selenocysteine-containing dehydrogenase